ncbi:FkbM family methyltransferase [Halomonas alkaliantarctica]|nr:FkbM family methyltransferase [Halomonas alkaliantarctica]
MLNIKTQHGVTVCAPDNIALMTPYILLEQEAWFEDELEMLPQLLPPNCSALDIGANHGIYTLVLARYLQQKASGGRVLAFEPNTALHPLIHESLACNGLANYVSLFEEGFSNVTGQATFHIPPNPELASLAPVAGAREVVVTLTTLDSFKGTLNNGERIGLVKLDAEGAELDILAGGHAFLAEHQPIVMFEIKHGRELNHGLAEAFIERGYALYRVLPDLSLLEPVNLELSLDGYQLNLIACPPHEVKRLAQEGLLTTTPLASLESPVLPEKNAAASFERLANPESLTANLKVALAHLQAALDSSVDRHDRRAHAHHALQQLQTLPVDAQGGDVSLAMARLHHLLGQRQQAVSTLKALLPQMNASALDSLRWRVAPHPAFDHQAVKEDPAGWQRCAAYEALVHLSSYSGYFGQDLNLLKAIHRQPHHSLAMERRLALALLKQGQKITIRPDSALCSNQHLNGETWRRIAQGEVVVNDKPSQPEQSNTEKATLPEGIWLHVGGKEPKAGWQMLNITPGPGVDMVGDIRDLSHIDANNCARIYASHVLVHIHQKEVLPVLKGFSRLLKPGGELMISVPDLDILCRLYLDKRLNIKQRHHVMRMMFGGQTDTHDFHYVGFNFEFLASQLKTAGFNHIQRVESFGLFSDTSDFAPYGQRISLNIVARH